MVSNAADPNVIHVHVRDWRQLFDSRDPAPFFDRDLDDDAAAYIVESLVDLGKHANKIVISLTADQQGLDHETDLSDAIRRHFGYELRRLRIRHRQLLKEGFAALAVGLCVLAAMTLGIKQLQTEGPNARWYFLREGLLILGWVAMWRPFDILVYSWWPYLSSRQTLRTLTALPIEIRHEVLPPKR